MLKGHVFKEQIFGNQIFALFINTFLNGQNGVSNNYKNGMQVTYSGSTLTIQSGAVCIQGRFLEEDTSTDISAGTDSSYCKLVIEIDLDKQNTESQLSQASYKIVKSSSGYPNLTQNDIVKNNAGIYQYELARFRTSSSGITNFQDMRTFFDLDTIYEQIEAEYQIVLSELEQELEEVQDGSAYVLKNNFAIITGSMTLNASDTNLEYASTTKTIDFPSGFNKDNCVLVAAGRNVQNINDFGYAYGICSVTNNISTGMLTGASPFIAWLGSSPDSSKITIYAYNETTSPKTLYYRLVLMKIC